MVNKPAVINVCGLILLQIVILFLKEFKVVNWTWFWVLSPMWMSYIAGLAIFFVLIIRSIIEDKKGNTK